ncbi:MAG TPA: glycosyltransferase [Nodosilinea sp.]|nr:glycosyltransferase [Nodosilinea sp.]
MLQTTHPIAYRAETPSPPHVLLVTPVFNDWPSLTVLLEELDLELVAHGMSAEILAVDDGSSIPPLGSLNPAKLTAIQKVNVLRLKRNLGHQRAITIGLAYAEANLTADLVVVMDSDGEDTPIDVIRLIRICASTNYQKIVFARRSQRSESWIFKLFYRAYRAVYRLLTGFDIQVGNFSAIPFAMLHRLVVVSEIWNHYAAGTLKSKLPHTDIPTQRGYRYRGESKMNFASLITHGLSAISVYGEMVGVRLLIASCGLIGISVMALLGVIGVRLMTDLAIPGWTSYLVLALISVILQAFIISLSFIFLVLIGRNNGGFLPNRDYHHFVLTLDEVTVNI